jgi:hypothetical protein
MKISEMITDKYKLRIPPTVYYDLLADVQELEEEQEPTIKALGEELRKARKGIADEKVLIGYNMAVAICNKHLGGSEVDNGNDD